jgi:uncharacterized phage protein gp47/JayE
MTYGVTSAGFVDKPVEVALAEIEAAQKAAFGATFDVTAQSPAGQINGIFAAHLRELWEVAQAIYLSWDPDQNTGETQTAIAALTGTVRRAATKSTVTATVNLNAGVTLSAGAVASVTGSPDSRFVTLADATNSGGSPADVSVAMEAETAGAVIANAGTLTEIETPVTGWNSITNAADATIGSEIEADEELRIRRETELRRAGAAAVDAIRADVLDVDTVVNCTVFENTADVTDGDGVPPHAIEVVVLSNPTSGDEDDIAQAIWDSVAAGIERHGGTSGNATDDAGGTQVIEFTRPSAIPLYANIEVTVDSDYPSDGDAQIKAALVAWAQNLSVGEDVIWSALYPIVFGISGVTDVTTLEILDSDPPTGGTSNIAIGARELATLASGDIDVTST